MRSKVILAILLGLTTSAPLLITNNVLSSGFETTLLSYKKELIKETPKKESDSYTEIEKDFTATIDSVAYGLNSTSIKITVTNDSTNNYYFGYRGEGAAYKPASLQYTITDSSNVTSTEIVEFNIVNTNNPYEILGIKTQPSLGAYEFSGTCDIYHSYGAKVDLESLRIVNLFVATKNDSGWSYNSSINYAHNIDENTETDISEYDYEDLIEKVTYDGYSTFGDYTSYRFTFKNTIESFYKKYFASDVRKYSEELEDGSYYLRLRIYFNGDIKAVFKDSTVKYFSCPIEYAKITTEDSDLYLTFNQFKPDEIDYLELHGCSLAYGMYSVSQMKEISRSSGVTRFGLINLNMNNVTKADGTIVYKKAEKNIKTYNLTLFMIIFTISFTLLYVAGMIGLYFILKKKNENDEFKRMRPKVYFKEGLLGLLGLDLIVIFIESCVFRFGYLQNSLTAYNPVDIWVILFGVGSVIAIGYFIKYFYTSIKNKIEKKKRDELNKSSAYEDSLTIDR